MKKWSLTAIFAYYLAFLLAGYAVLGKSFAYIGIGKLYVSEIGLIIGLLAAFVAIIKGELNWHKFRQPSVLILLAFLFWSILCTIPYVSQYKLFAIRDAMLWGYSAYALLIYLLIPNKWIERFQKRYGQAIPFILLWWIVAFYLTWFSGINWNSINPAFSFYQLKTGDIAVHLAGIAAFLLLNLDKDQSYNRSTWLTWVIWILWWINWLINSASSRAAMLNPLLALFLITFVTLKSLKRWMVPVFSGVILFAVLFFTHVSIPIPDPTRNVTVSIDQVQVNLASLLGKAGEKLAPASAAVAPAINEAGELTAPTVLRAETIQWRIAWWKKIVSYTVTGPYFWTGKGYGINLADDAGFQVFADQSLRSPHNVFMTILARSGVPGLVLWVGFIISIAYLLLKSLLNKQNSNGRREIAAWHLVYLLAFLFNASFDVYLEGPMGGVWFWCLVGSIFVHFLERQNSERVNVSKFAPLK